MKQYDSLYGPNFGVVLAELQDKIHEGWEIDFDNYPIDNFTHYEIHLVRAEQREAVKAVFSEKSFPDGEIFAEVIVPEAPKKQAGRPTRVKQ